LICKEPKRPEGNLLPIHSNGVKIISYGAKTIRHFT
jgi:hypothetical protein